MKDYFGIDKVYVSKLANSVARKSGFGVATKVSFDNVDSPEIGESIQFGYRKYTTGEYVSNAYRNNFGWKNTYYQSAECEVVLPNRYEHIAQR